MKNLFRAFIRSIAHTWIRLNYRVTVHGGEAALACEEGSLVLARHVSRLDAILLLSEAWPYARVYPTAWHVEYSHWLQFPFMKLFGVISVGSPKHLDKRERALRTAKSKARMSMVLASQQHLLIFPEGHIGDGVKAVVPRHLTGAYDALCAYPGKPILMIDIKGLGRNRPRRFWSRPQVDICIKRVHHLSAQSPAFLNSQIEAWFNA